MLQPIIELRVISSEAFLKRASELSRHSKSELMEMVEEISRCLPGPYRITMDGKDVPNPDYYVAPKKLYAWKSADAVNFVALFFHNINNLKLYWDVVEKPYKELFSLIADHGPCSYSMLCTFGFGGMLSEKEARYSYDRVKIVNRHGAWFDTVLSRGVGDDWWRRASFIRLNPNYSVPAAFALGIVQEVHFESFPEGLEVCSAEPEALSSVPLIEAVLKQGTLKFSTARVTPASSWKFMKTLPIPEILPDFTEFGDKFNCGQLFLPLFNMMPAAKLKKPAPDVLKTAVEYLFGIDEEKAVPMLMPHIKGLRPAELRRCRAYCRDALKEYLMTDGHRWLDLDAAENWLSISALYTLNASAMESLALEDTLMGERITFGEVVKFDREMLGALSVALYCLGMAEVAVTPQESYSDLFTHIRAVRLTALGRYAFGLSDSYQAPSLKKEPLFALDSDRLIIRSLKPGNPYEGLLLDTSSPIGSGRFLMSPESFLKNCKTRKDVKEKADFFRQYICTDPPRVWQDFFKTIERRCNPLWDDPAEYLVYVLDPSDTGLVDLITSDPVLKAIAIKAEGYRILVPRAKKTAFVNRLKTFGYLL